MEHCFGDVNKHQFQNLRPVTRHDRELHGSHDGGVSEKNPKERVLIFVSSSYVSNRRSQFLSAASEIRGPEKGMETEAHHPSLFADK